MFNFFLTLHFIIAIFLTLVIIIQKKEGDGGGALGFGGGRADGAFTPRGEANILTKTTYVLAGLFVANCLLIGNLVDRSHPAAKDTLAADVARHANVGVDNEKAAKVVPSDGKNTQNSGKPVVNTNKTDDSGKNAATANSMKDNVGGTDAKDASDMPAASDAKDADGAKSTSNTSDAEND